VYAPSLPPPTMLYDLTMVGEPDLDYTAYTEGDVQTPIPSIEMTPEPVWNLDFVATGGLGVGMGESWPGYVVHEESRERSSLRREKETRSRGRWDEMRS
jgi:hypothetical protein